MLTYSFSVGAALWSSCANTRELGFPNKELIYREILSQRKGVSAVCWHCRDKCLCFIKLWLMYIVYKWSIITTLFIVSKNWLLSLNQWLFQMEHCYSKINKEGFFCGLCFKEFNHAQQRNRHFKYCELNKDRTPLDCGICFKTFW